MKWYRIWAMVVRHLVQLPTDFNKLSSVIYWPIVDLVLMGCMGLAMSSPAAPAQAPLILLVGISLWQVVNRACLGVALNLLEELWTRNVTNLFATSLTLGEWIASVVVEGVIMLSALLMLCAWVVYLMYGLSIFVLGWWLLPFSLLAYGAGLALGFMASACLLIWGQRVQSLVWMVCWGFAIVSGAFYPISVLPSSLQSVAHVLPLEYIFQSVRELLMTGEVPVQTLLYAIALDCFYVILAIFCFVKAFAYSKRRGLARLMD
jgi:ABC-2 type transport system permease protein